MKVAIEKEQLKAVVRQAMISVLEDDVYSDRFSTSAALDAYTDCAEDWTAAGYSGSPSYAEPWRRAVAAMTARDRKRAAHRPAALN